MRSPFVVAFAALASTSACQKVPINLATQITTDAQTVEQSIGGRVGVALVDQYGSLLFEHRGQERFAFCSTFKLFLAGMVLDGSRAGAWSLNEALPVSKADMLPHSPVAETYVDRGSISMREAARAAVVESDNAAANLLLRKMGGIPAFNDWMRRHYDKTTRLDRFETDLNQNVAGDPRDTSSPVQMARSAAGLVLGFWLPTKERQILRNWLIESRTGVGRIRAGVPAEWTVGDKTGTCGGSGRSAYNDVAFIQPHGPDGEGFLLAVFLDDPKSGGAEAETALARIARSSVAIIQAK